jgi:hypothetical protein
MVACLLAERRTKGVVQMAQDVEITRREVAPPPAVDRVVTAPAYGPPLARAGDAELVPPRDRLRWGPVWGGLLTALTAFLVLQLLMYGFGWLTLDFTGRDATDPGDAWVSTLMALLAFFAGGWVAQATSSVRGADAGLLSGFMVWALATALILLLSTLGLGLAFGPVGSVLNQFGIVGRGDLRSLDPAAVEGAFRDGTLWAALFLLASAAAAAAGGWLGDRKPDEPIGHVEAETAQVQQ